MGGGVVLLTFAAVIVAVAVDMPWLTPLMAAGPAAFYLARYSPTRSDDEIAVIFLRWAVTVLLTTLFIEMFIPGRTLTSIPMGAGIPGRVSAWITSGGPPPLGVGLVAATAGVYIVLAVLSAGVFACVLLGWLLMLDAAFAAHLFTQAYNVFEVALVALPPWQWFLLVGLAWLFPPLRALSRATVLRRGGEFHWSTWRRSLAVGAALVLAAILVAIAVAGPYRALVARWTVL